jgi:hypothetical protein
VGGGGGGNWSGLTNVNYFAAVSHLFDSAQFCLNLHFHRVLKGSTFVSQRQTLKPNHMGLDEITCNLSLNELFVTGNT